MVQQKLIKEKGNLRLTGISADQILELLQKKHQDDVFIPECKNGETWGARDLLKLDAWVLKRSYSPLTAIGYEIKTSRQDFEKDQKWAKYVDLCHEFYFVCPGGLIRATDLPSRIGIIWTSKDRLYTKRKAERVAPDEEKLNHLLIYALMARSVIVASMHERDRADPKDRLTQMREEVERATAHGELALFVKGHVRDIYEELRRKEADLNYRENHVKEFEAKLAKLGIVWDSEKSDWVDNNRVSNEIGKLKKVLDIWTLRNMKATGQNMVKLANELERFLD